MPFVAANPAYTSIENNPTMPVPLTFDRSHASHGWEYFIFLLQGVAMLWAW